MPSIRQSQRVDMSRLEPVEGVGQAAAPVMVPPPPGPFAPSPMMHCSMPPLAAGYDQYVRQFYRDGLPQMRSLPVPEAVTNTTPTATTAAANEATNPFRADNQAPSYTPATLTGTVDGVNKVFTIPLSNGVAAANPTIYSSDGRVLLNGVDYTLVPTPTGTIVTFTVAPTAAPVSQPNNPYPVTSGDSSNGGGGTFDQTAGGGSGGGSRIGPTLGGNDGL